MNSESTFFQNSGINRNHAIKFFDSIDSKKIKNLSKTDIESLRNNIIVNSTAFKSGKEEIDAKYIEKSDKLIKKINSIVNSKITSKDYNLTLKKFDMMCDKINKHYLAHQDGINFIWDYLRGANVEEEEFKSFIRDLAKNGNSSAQFIMYLYTDDPEMSSHLLQQAADNGNGNALYELYLDSSPELGMDLLRRAAKDGCIVAMVALGEKLQKRGKLSDAMTHFERAVKLGHRERVLLCKMGEIYESMGDFNSALKTYKKIQEQEIREERISRIMGQSPNTKAPWGES